VYVHLNPKSGGAPDPLRGGDSADAQFRTAVIAANRDQQSRLQADAMKYGQQAEANTTGTNVSVALYARPHKKRNKTGSV
jgi:hypothetical protein